MTNLNNQITGVPSLSEYSSLHFLIADDVMLNRMIIEGLLKPQGHKVTHATNGEEVLGIIEKSGYFKGEIKPFDIILMDMEMPVINGIDATRRLRERERSLGGSKCGDKFYIPVVGLSAHTKEEVSASIESSGMDAFLTKSSNLNGLDAVLNQVFGATAKGHSKVTAKTTVSPTPPPPPPSALLQKANNIMNEHAKEIRIIAGDNGLAIIDLAEFLARYRNNENIIRSLLRCFVSEVTGLSNDLTLAYENGVIEEIRQKAHALRGSCGSISAFHAESLASKLELAASNSQKDAFPNLYNQLIRSVDFTLKIVNKLIQQ